MSDATASLIVAFGLGVCTGLLMSLVYAAWLVYEFARRIRRRNVA